MAPTQRWGCTACEVLQSATFPPICWCCAKPMIPSSQLPPKPWFVPYRYQPSTYP